MCCLSWESSQWASRQGDSCDRYLIPPSIHNQKHIFSKLILIWGVRLHIWTTDGIGVTVCRHLLRRESDTYTTKNNKYHAGLFVVVFTPKQQQRVGREGGKGEEDETKGGVRAGEKHPAEIRGFGEGVFIQNSSSAWGITSTDRRFGQWAGRLLLQRSKRWRDGNRHSRRSTCSQLPSQPALGYSVLVGHPRLLLFCEADETSWVRAGERYSTELLRRLW